MVPWTKEVGLSSGQAPEQAGLVRALGGDSAQPGLQAASSEDSGIFRWEPDWEPFCSKVCWCHLASSIGGGAATPEDSSCGWSRNNKAQGKPSQELEARFQLWPCPQFLL